jgi:integrase
MYSGKSDELKTKGSNRKLPLPQELEGRLLRLRTNDADSFIFHSRNGTPLNPGNWMRREVRPAATRLGIALTGWHDFRHFFSRRLRKSGVHPKLVSTLLGHSKVNLAMDVYDQADEQDLRGALLQVVTQRREAA